METVYDFCALDKEGNKVNLSQYKGNVLLVVNTATGCGFSTKNWRPCTVVIRTVVSRFSTSLVISSGIKHLAAMRKSRSSAR